MRHVRSGWGDLVLGAVAVVLGLACALGYAAYRAVSADSGRGGAIREPMQIPGLQINAPLAPLVVLGWKANID
jgi:hypothetical protein